MKIQVLAMIACLLVFIQFTHAETKIDADQTKLKDATALTPEQKVKEDLKLAKELKLKEAAAKAKEEAKSVKEQKIMDTAAPATSPPQKTAVPATATKDKSTVKNQKTKDKTATNDKTKNNTAATTNTAVKNNEIDPAIQALIDQQIKEKNIRKNYKTTYSSNGKDLIVTYQNDQGSKYSPSKTKLYPKNTQSIDGVQATSAGYSESQTRESAEQLKQKKMYVNDKKMIAGLKGNFNDEWKVDALDTLKTTRVFLEKLKDAGFQYKDITAITANADEKAFWKGKSSNSGEISISPDSDPGLIANMMGLGFYEKLRDKGYKAQSGQDMAEVIRYFTEARMGNSKWEPAENAAVILKSCTYSEEKFIAMLKNGEMKKLLNK